MAVIERWSVHTGRIVHYRPSWKFSDLVVIERSPEQVSLYVCSCLPSFFPHSSIGSSIS